LFSRKMVNLKLGHQLYEDDARIGHQEFDLKLTNRVKMCMVRLFNIHSLLPYMSTLRWESPRCLSICGLRKSFAYNFMTDLYIFVTENSLLKVSFPSLYLNGGIIWVC
jgi:hypothetical protein